MPTPTDKSGPEKTRADKAPPRKQDPAQVRPILFAPQYWPTWFGLGLLRLIEPLPYPILMGFGRIVGRIVRRLPTHFARVVRANLRLCMPELAEQQREELLKRHFDTLGMALMETAIAWWSSDARIKRLTRVEGIEHLEQALAKGKGALLLSAHFTNLEIGCRALNISVPLNIMYRPTSNPVMAFFLARNRAHHTKRAIPRDDIRTLISALKENDVVWYAPDQAYRKKGAQLVPFFGIPCATNTATSRLARMTQAQVLPYFSERLPNNAGYRAIIHPPFENFPSDDPIADAVRYHKAIEAHIAQAPDQYLWIHRRFKGLGEDYPNYYKRDAS
jgi:KDO2-lipid IV(A) lauroyltransferase